jgi:hypothetical protein
MFTGARLVAGLILGLSGIVVGMLLVDADQNIQHLRSEVIYLLGAVGFMVGWRGLGKRVGKGYPAALGFGLRAAFSVALWSMLLAALYEVFRNIFKHAGDGYMVPVIETFQYTVDIARYSFQLPIVLTAIGLGLVCGLVTEYVNKIWP